MLLQVKIINHISKISRLQARFKRPRVGCGIAVFLAQTAALCCALLIGASRIADNKHHPMDVVAGAALGVTVQVLLVQNLIF